MKVIAILEIDPDKVLSLAYDCEADEIKGNIEEAIERELGWAEESGMYVKEVICPDSLKPNDADLGKMIRSKMED